MHRRTRGSLNFAGASTRSRCDATSASAPTELPVIPIIVNCLAGMPAPLHRCHSLGVAIRRTVERWPERVALLCTGGLSHWPAMPESGQIGIYFDRRFLDAFLNGRIESFLCYPKGSSKPKLGRVGTRSAPGLPSPEAAGDARGSLLAYHLCLLGRPAANRGVGNRGSWSLTFF